MMSRGPDGWGEFSEDGMMMAMRRLAVIDLAHGNQPFFDGSGEIVAFQNGEIYNFRTLRAELEVQSSTFVSKSDTEVLAHGYAAWGIDRLLKKLDGMYALAIYDKREKTLHLARDRFGEKPLFIAHGSGCFAYASSLIPLAALPWVDIAIDSTSLDRYLALHYVPGDATLFKGIRRLLPGERLELSLFDMSIRRHRFFVPELTELHSISADVLAAQLEEAVVTRLLADVPVGVFLSGGVDSSLIAAVAAKHAPGIRTFSIRFTEKKYDESTYAQATADHIKSTHSTFQFGMDSFRSLLPQVAQALDEPVGDQAILPTYWLSREASKLVTVVLSGEGADELFGGYDYYKLFQTIAGIQDPLDLPSFLDNRLPVTASGFPLVSDYDLRRTLTERDPPEATAWEKRLLHDLSMAVSPLQKALATDLLSWLPSDLLVKVDRMTMAHSIEGRAPYLNPRLATTALNMPDNMRLNNTANKIILRRIAERWLPRHIVYRPKQGFVLPMRRWLHEWIHDHGGPFTFFANIDMIGLSPCETAKIVEEDAYATHSRERLIFALVLLVEWHHHAIARINALRTAIQR
jgi:asparagine synthase (glutamine-hydrolysing)